MSQLSAGRKIVLAIGLLKKYRDAREKDYREFAAVTPQTWVSDASCKRIRKELKEIEEVLNHLGTLTLGDITN